MKYITFLLRTLTTWLDLRFALHLNRLKYKQGMIPDFEYRLRKQFLKTNQQFGTTDFYQNYPPLKISGKRDTLSRVRSYNIESKLSKDLTMLDIGGNIGFFSAYLSRFVKHIDIVEQNSKLVDVCRALLNHENIQNVNVFNSDFKKFVANHKYDVVMSLAIHKWVGLDLQDYLKSIHSLLTSGGLLLIESHLLFKLQGEMLQPELSKCTLFEIIERGEVDDHEGTLREFFWLKAM